MIAHPATTPDASGPADGSECRHPDSDGRRQPGHSDDYACSDTDCALCNEEPTE